MAKVKTSKKDTFIDMTAMSDVTVLLLTFFMLTANFIPLEPVQVVTPASVIETKVPDYNFVTILVDPQGHVFLNLDRPGRQAGSIGEDGRTLRHRVHRTGEGEFRRADHLCRRADEGDEAIPSTRPLAAQGIYPAVRRHSGRQHEQPAGDMAENGRPSTAT